MSALTRLRRSVGFVWESFSVRPCLSLLNFGGGPPVNIILMLLEKGRSGYLPLLEGALAMDGIGFRLHFSGPNGTFASNNATLFWLLRFSNLWGGPVILGAT